MVVVDEGIISAHIVGIAGELRSKALAGKLTPAPWIDKNKELSKDVLPSSVGLFLKSAERELVRSLKGKDVPSEMLEKIFEKVRKAAELYFKGDTKKAQEVLAEAYRITMKA